MSARLTGGSLMSLAKPRVMLAKLRRQTSERHSIGGGVGPGTNLPYSRALRLRVPAGAVSRHDRYILI